MDLKNPTRTESLLANIAGYTGVPVPDMKNATRSERLLKEILDNGGGGGGGGGGDVTKEYVDNAIADAVADIDDDISALSDTVADKVDKENGKSLSTNDYTDADKALVQDSPITVSATGTDLALSTSEGNINALTVYGKSEVVDGSIKSAGEGYAVVRLADLTWDFSEPDNLFTATIRTMKPANTVEERITGLYCGKYKLNPSASSWTNMPLNCYQKVTKKVGIKDANYNNVTDFVNALDDATLCYQLENPTQGNTIAIKTDNGSGINGTMATFTTGTPLRGIPDTDVKDVMAWDGSAGTVTKNCVKVRLADLTWGIFENRFYTSNLRNIIAPFVSPTAIPNILSNQYITTSLNNLISINKSITVDRANDVNIRDTDYTTLSDFVASLGDAELIYELATPTTEQLTTAENASIAGLRTFTPQTHAQNNAGAEMKIEAYAGTENGKAVNELKQDVQSEITALKITQSDTLTLTTSGWSNNVQTVTYAHDTAKRNVIDVDPASVEEWASCGVLATAETASGITFSCKTVPQNALSFRVTSMGVN